MSKVYLNAPLLHSTIVTWVMKPLLLPILVLFLISSYAYPQDSNKKVDWDKIEQRLFKDLKEKHGKSDAETYQAIGFALLKSDNQWERAIVHFKKALELDPTLHLSWYNLGLIYMDTEEGNEYMSKAIEAKPIFSPPYYWLAYTHCRNGRDKEAIPIFERYLEVAKDDFNEQGRIWFAEQVLRELLAGEEGEHLKKIRKPE